MRWRTGFSGRAWWLGAAMALAAAALLSLAGPALSSNSPRAVTASGGDVYGSLPSAGSPTPGGTITFGQLTGETPEYVLPIVPGLQSTPGTIDLISNLFVPLYAGPDGALPEDDNQLSLADPPVASNHDRTYTINIKPGFRWTDGQPVDAQDVVFGFDLLRAAVAASPANWSQGDPGEFPGDVTSITASSQDAVTLTLNRAYNPTYFLYDQLQDTDLGLYAMPSTAWNLDRLGGAHLTDWSKPAVAKAIYEFLNKQSLDLKTWAGSPLWQDVDGPYKLTRFNASNGGYTLTPNADYGGSVKPSATVDAVTYTSSDAETDALRAGTLDIDSFLSPADLGDARAFTAAGDSVFGAPGWGWFGGIINFRDKTDDFDKVIAQSYVRAAIEHLVDQPAIIKSVYHGAAVPAYGPVPDIPGAAYAPADAFKAPYGYSPAAAVQLLRSHGWKVAPNGTTVCARPGTGADACGAGIPRGTPIKFVWANLPATESETGVLESETLASAAKRYAGITIDLRTRPFNFLVGDYNDANPEAARYTNDWGVNNYGGLFQDYDPTQSGVETPHGGFNTGGYDNATASRLIAGSVFGPDPSAVRAEASYLTRNLPVFYMPDEDTLEAVSSRVGGPANAFLTLTQQLFQPQYLYVKP
jgi:peptide/nickel transport system substrate-binding protein